MMMNFNEWAKEIHENAKHHGWWERDRDEKEIFALIHSEWSEALEEDRAGRPMVFADDYEGKKRIENMEHFPDGAKPEGVAVELIDGVIRILDFMAYKGMADKCTVWPVCHVNYNLPQLVAKLHVVTAMAQDDTCIMQLINAVSLAWVWIRNKGFDPEEIMQIKHEFNVRRPHKHGKRY